MAWGHLRGQVSRRVRRRSWSEDLLKWKGFIARPCSNVEITSRLGRIIPPIHTSQLLDDFVDPPDDIGSVIRGTDRFRVDNYEHEARVARRDS